MAYSRDRDAMIDKRLCQQASAVAGMVCVRGGSSLVGVTKLREAGQDLHSIRPLATTLRLSI